jgi:hypothetical protein
MGRFRFNFHILTNRKTFRDVNSDSPLRKLLEVIRSEIAGSTKFVPDEDIGDGDGSNKEFSGTLAHPGVKPGTLVIHAVVVGDTTETFTDKGDGTLVSDDGGSGTIQYETGDYTVAFNKAPKNEENVYADYVGYFTTYKFTADGLNPIYDARFVSYTSGKALDYWGETLDLPRNCAGKAMESDEDYCVRLLAELRDFTEALMVETVKEKVEYVLGTGKTPEVTEIWALAPDWPITWCNDDPDKVFTTWAPWDGLVDFLVILPSEEIEDELLGTGNGTQTHFEGTLANPPVKRKTVSITDGVETFTDDGKGALTGDKGGEGSINYDTGAYSIDFNSPPGNGIEILADYAALADPSEAELSQMADLLVGIKFAPARILIVDDSGGEYYILRKKVL